ncbi:MAG TPA: hypothetical protein VHT27_03810 [Solirubrobacteraceae bacterium]|jgi:hypothetical protein|nr:hypothetical protein [Solirubrobacteraceae bacterium]
MRTTHRPRRYLAQYWIFLLRPFLRYSPSRRAYVLRIIGSLHGPVLRVDRRTATFGFDGAERRRARVA